MRNRANLQLNGCVAFTILELLVAMMVMSVLVVMLMAMVDNASKLWRANESQIESYREARAALNLITGDLKSIYASTNQDYFRTNGVGFNFSTDPADGRIFFIAALPVSAQESGSKSDLCEVGYYLTYTNNSILNPNSAPAYSLHRYFRSSDATFTNLAIPAQQFIYTTTNAELLARNIPAFKIKYYYLTNGIPQPWTQSAAKPVPDFVEIQVTAFNNEASKRLSNPTDWKDTNSSAYRENARVFTARVPIRQPL